MTRQTMVAIIATAALSSGTTAALTQLASPAPAAGADSATLRQINNKLRALGTSKDSGIWGTLDDVRRDQAKMCRALATRSYDCPLP